MATAPPLVANCPFLAGGGTAGELIRAQDWGATALGPPAGWPRSLKTAVALLLASPEPAYIGWGPDLLSFYNDGYLPILGPRPAGIGRPFRELWAELWDELSPLIRRTLDGETQHFRDMPLTVARPSRPDGYFSFTYTPLWDDADRIGGFYCAATETTDRVLEKRRESLLLDLLDHTRGLADPEAVAIEAAGLLGRHLGATRVLYAEVDEPAAVARIAGEWAEPGVPPFPSLVRLDDFDAPLIARLRAGEALRIDDIARHPHMRESAAALAALSVAAFVSVPLFKDDRFVVSLTVHQSTPREWADHDVQLIEAVAERIWEAVERARAEVARDRAAALGAGQARVLELAVSDAPLGQTLEAIAVTVEGLSTSGVLASILLLDEDGVTLRHGAAPSLPSAYNQAIDGIVIGRQVGSCGTAAHRNAPVFVADIAHDPLWADFRGLALDHGLRACWSIPIRSRQGAVLGTFAMYHREPREPQLADLEIVDFVVRTAGLAIERARAEDALRRSEARYRQIVEGAEDFAIVTFDADGVVTGWNSGAERVVGYPAAAAVGQPGDFFYTPEDRSAGVFAAETRRARREGRGVNERWHVRQGGVRFWGSGLMMPLAMDHGGFVKIFRDRTAEHTAEAAREEHEERLRLATDNAEVGFWDVDEVNGVLHWPPIVKAMFGISADAPVSMADFYAGLHPEDAAAAAAAYAAAADPACRALYDVEYRTVGKEDGVIRWVAAKGRGVFDEGGRCVRVIGTAVDISFRKTMEAKLLELNETLERRVAETSADLDRVWRNAGDLLLVVDGDAVVRRINPAASRILGWSEAEMIGRSILDLLHPDDMAISLVALAEARERPLSGFENRYVTRTGEVRTIRWTTAPEQSFIYAYGRDVTEERKREAELALSQEALRQAQKMEAMGQLTGGVAHDFNNLLTPIVGSLDMLQRKGLGGEREQRLIAAAIQSAERAKTLVQRLLAFARRQPLQPVPVDIAQLIVGMGELVESTTGPQIKVVVDAPGDLPPAKADPNQLEMALLNLSVNARDAMPEGGTLRISASSEQVEGAHRAKLRPGAYIRLSVADTGEGMDEETAARAVEPFFSTKGIGKGTGLGLSMVHGLASQLGGALTIQSRRGMGTHVELWLPVSAAPAETSRPAALAASIPSHRGIALLVDDEELARMSTADMLVDLGFEVVEAGSAEEAVRLFEKDGPFAIVVTDHLMPGMTGTDLARHLQNARPGLPVLLVSGYAEADGVDLDLPRLAKPFRKDDLAASLAALQGP